MDENRTYNHSPYRIKIFNKKNNFPPSLVFFGHPYQTRSKSIFILGLITKRIDVDFAVDVDQKSEQYQYPVSQTPISNFTITDISTNSPADSCKKVRTNNRFTNFKTAYH
jgi:hypothetical protein